MGARHPSAQAVARLRHPDTIRGRCRRVLWLLESGGGSWRVERERLDEAIRLVAEVTLESHPDLDLPLHGRWRHFQVGGVDRTSRLPRLADPRERGRMLVELVVVSVLLDAGAGGDWRYRTEDGAVLERSEGLAVASLEAFLSGRFSSRGAPEADAGGLERVTVDGLAEAFRAGDGNPMVGLEGRLGLLHGLGSVARDLPHHRVGGIFDLLLEDAGGGRVEAADLLAVLLGRLAPLWPDSIRLEGVPLGDVWRYPPLPPGEDLVPFHKLVQWLAYSLVEPLAASGLVVTALDQLTALAEYRNGGLLVDAGVLVPRHPDQLDRAHPPGSPFVVEWRAATVVLIDEVAEGVRARLGRPDLSLAQLLEGGTWRAGRRMAERLRGGAPPVRVTSDGTLF